MTKSKTLYPGWRMTVAQHGRYFWLLADACAAQGAVSTAAKEALRKQAHRAAFGFEKSAKDINADKEFTAIANEFRRLGNVVETETNERRQSIYVARQRLTALAAITAPGYIETLLKQRFKVIPGLRAVEDLSRKQLTDLITTVNNRIRTLSSVTQEADPF